MLHAGSLARGLVAQMQRRGVPLDGQHAGARGAVPRGAAQRLQVQRADRAGRRTLKSNNENHEGSLHAARSGSSKAQLRRVLAD